MGLSDNIALFIQELLNNEDGYAEIGRNELALRFHVVPSQINYVITSRFSSEQGYLVESRRGGGGYIRIRRVHNDQASYLMHIINSIGKQIDSNTIAAYMNNMVSSQILSINNARLIAAAVSDKALSSAPTNIRDYLRASIFKNTLIQISINE